MYFPNPQIILQEILSIQGTDILPSEERGLTVTLNNEDVQDAADALTHTELNDI